MSERFAVADWHFGHTNSWAKFKRSDGSPLRPFTSTEEMDEAMISRHNAKVGKKDTVYVLGDCVINRKSLHQISRLNGRKILIRGNHDIFDDNLYREVGFEQIHGCRVFVDKWIMTHIPLHPECVTDRFRVNVHGHLHANEIMRVRTKQWIEKVPHPIASKLGWNTTVDKFRSMTVTEPDPRYICVSVEHTDFAPVSFDEIEERIQRRWEQTEYTPPKNSGWGNGSAM